MRGRKGGTVTPSSQTASERGPESAGLVGGDGGGARVSALSTKFEIKNTKNK